MLEAVLNIVAACFCIALLVWNLVCTRRLTREAQKAQIQQDLLEPLIEKARLYDEAQARMGILLDAREASVRNFQKSCHTETPVA